MQRLSHIDAALQTAVVQKESTVSSVMSLATTTYVHHANSLPKSVVSGSNAAIYDCTCCRCLHLDDSANAAYLVFGIPALQDLQQLDISVCDSLGSIGDFAP